MEHDLDALVLHFLEVEHEEGEEVVGEDELSGVVGAGEVVLVIVGYLHFHVLFEALWELLDDLFDNIVNLLKLTAKSGKHPFTAEVTIHVDHVGLQDLDLLTL